MEITNVKIIYLLLVLHLSAALSTDNTNNNNINNNHNSGKTSSAASTLGSLYRSARDGRSERDVRCIRCNYDYDDRASNQRETSGSGHVEKSNHYSNRPAPPSQFAHHSYDSEPERPPSQYHESHNSHSNSFHQAPPRPINPPAHPSKPINSLPPSSSKMSHYEDSSVSSVHRYGETRPYDNRDKAENRYVTNTNNHLEQSNNYNHNNYDRDVERKGYIDNRGKEGYGDRNWYYYPDRSYDRYGYEDRYYGNRINDERYPYRPAHGGGGAASYSGGYDYRGNGYDNRDPSYYDNTRDYYNRGDDRYYDRNYNGGYGGQQYGGQTYGGQSYGGQSYSGQGYGSQYGGSQYYDRDRDYYERYPNNVRGYDYKNYRPWDETYRGTSGFDTTGRGYYFSSRPSNSYVVSSHPIKPLPAQNTASNYGSSLHAHGHREGSSGRGNYSGTGVWKYIEDREQDKSEQYNNSNHNSNNEHDSIKEKDSKKQGTAYGTRPRPLGTTSYLNDRDTNVASPQMEQITKEDTNLDKLKSVQSDNNKSMENS